MRKPQNGFTLIELLVVMAIIATLLSIVTPRYFHSVDKSKEAILLQDLDTMRDAIDKYYGDIGHYPDTLDDLVDQKYLRKIPPDPITDSPTTWITTQPPADAPKTTPSTDDTSKEGVYDVHSGAVGNSSNGTPYSTW
jgi:general secretion pathway protein G